MIDESGRSVGRVLLVTCFRPFFPHSIPSSLYPVSWGGGGITARRDVEFPTLRLVFRQTTVPDLYEMVAVDVGAEGRLLLHSVALSRQ